MLFNHLSRTKITRQRLGRMPVSRKKVQSLSSLRKTPLYRISTTLMSLDLKSSKMMTHQVQVKKISSLKIYTTRLQKLLGKNKRKEQQKECNPSINSLQEGITLILINSKRKPNTSSRSARINLKHRNVLSTIQYRKALIQVSQRARCLPILMA